MSDVSVTLYLNIKCLYILLHFDVNRIIIETDRAGENHSNFIIKSIFLLRRVFVITHRLILNTSIQRKLGANLN